jgi:hypothetical protein
LAQSEKKWEEVRGSSSVKQRKAQGKKRNKERRRDAGEQNLNILSRRLKISQPS